MILVYRYCRIELRGREISTGPRTDVSSCTCIRFVAPWASRPLSTVVYRKTLYTHLHIKRGDTCLFIYLCGNGVTMWGEIMVSGVMYEGYYNASITL